MTRCHWTLEYIDQMSLCRAVEMVEFLSRAPGEEIEEDEPATPVSEMDGRGLAEIQSLMGTGINVVPMPQRLKDAIGWAEEMKKKHGIN